MSRDQQLDRALKQQLRGMSAPAGDHLDSETLAAWADGGLDVAAMASVESHLSECPTCQSMAAVMARSAPIVAAEPRRAFRIPAWWFPIAAGAAAVTIWMVVPREQKIAVVAEATPPPAVAAPAEPAKPAAGLARDSLAQSQTKEQPPAREDRRERPAALAENKAATAGKLEDAQAAPAPSAPAPMPRPNAPAVAELQKSARLAFAPVEIVSPNASRRWRVLPGGIERSEDGGRTWIIVRPSAGEVLTGGIAPTESICWMIGRSGVVLVTVDGVTFARVPVPEGIDLASVSATDARSATVTAVDGRRFRTDDSGRTWHQI